MASPDLPVILYRYEFSPYAKRVEWYLWLRGIPYLECNQPLVLPRPDLSARLGIAHRRIPLLAIGRDVYADTRLILAKLETLFPPSTAHPGLTAGWAAEQRALARLLSRWMVDALFLHAVAAVPADLPVYADPAFQRDRADLVGIPLTDGAPSPFSRDALLRRRPDALRQLRDAADLLEGTLLADGRQWIAGACGGGAAQAPSLLDIEAAWLFAWLDATPGSFTEDEGVVCPSAFPKLFAWLHRLAAHINARCPAPGTPGRTSVAGDAAARLVVGSAFAEKYDEPTTTTAWNVDGASLRPGQTVLVWPSDYGSGHKDRGALVALSELESVIEVRGEAGSARLHAPRHGFKVKEVVEGVDPAKL